MTSERELRTRYDDILDEGDDAEYVQIVGDLENAYPMRRPPSVLYARIATSLEAQTAVRRGRGLAQLPGVGAGFWHRRRLSLAALVITIGAIGMGTSGLATAAIHTVQTRLFSAPPASPQAAVWVGSLQPPLWGGCAPRRATSPVTSPDGRSFAQLNPVPSGFTGSVAVTFPPCMPHPLRPGVVLPKQPATLVWENITIRSVVRYEGADGTLEVDTAQATAEGMRRGLYLGNPIGTLADGSRAFDLACGGGCAYRDNIRWVKDGLIVSVSGNMSVDRLKELAASVTLS